MMAGVDTFCINGLKFKIHDASISPREYVEDLFLDVSLTIHDNPPVFFELSNMINNVYRKPPQFVEKITALTTEMVLDRPDRIRVAFKDYKGYMDNPVIDETKKTVSFKVKDIFYY